MNELVVVRWTHFFDMHSGGGQKLDWPHIFIEAPEREAEVIFYNRFGRNPNRVTCTCCGEDYSISEEDSLKQATKYYRNAAYNIEPEVRDTTLDKYILEIVGRNPSRFDKRIQDLYRMARTKSSPKEAAIAMEKLALTDVEGMWHAKPLITFEDFVENEELDEHGTRTKVKVIYAKDIDPKERVGVVPREGYHWE